MAIVKVVLAYPGRPVTATQKSIYLHLPYSCLCLAAYVRERGYEVDVLDMRVGGWRDHDFAATRVLGIGCMTGHQIRHGLDLARHARASNPDIVLIWGGVHPTLYPEQTAEHPLVDFVVRGEGEETLFELLEALRAGTPLDGVAGLAYRRGGEVVVTPDRPPMADLDDLPFPAYDLVDVDAYPNVREVFDYQTSRGCPFRCAFCYNLAFTGRKWRAKSPEKVLSEIERIKARYGVQSLGLVDDEFFIDRKRTEQIVDGLIDRGLDLKWSASCRLDILQRYSDESLTKIRESGCQKLYFGAESGSQRILDSITKDIRVGDMFRAAEKCVKNGIPPILSFMSGFPRETTVDLRETYKVISELLDTHPKIVVNGCFIYNPYPGGDLFTEAVDRGMRLPGSFDGWGDWDYKYDAILPWGYEEKRREMRMMFLLVRFSYYWKELGRKDNIVQKYLMRACLLPLKLSFHLRWKRRWFSLGWEWEAWARLMQRVFGFM